MAPNNGEHDVDPHQTGGDATATSPLVEDLITRAKAILSELEEFRDRLKSLRKEKEVETAVYRSTVQSELEMLEKLATKPQTPSTVHAARSSNLPFYETVWSVAKTQKDLVALRKRVFVTQRLSDENSKTKIQDLSNRSQYAKCGKPTIVDVIADHGRSWIKVSLVTNDRLLMDLAKEGWHSGDSENENDDDTQPPAVSGFASDVPLVKNARQLTQAAKAFRIRTRMPSVHMVLPRIQLGVTPEVDKIIDQCREHGVTVSSGGDLAEPPLLENALINMAPDPISSFSDVLNVDCTILLAMVSEFSHAKVSKEPWFHVALQRQVEIEDNEKLLPTLIYPALGNRKLVSTIEAVTRMREIVETIGTPSEKARTAILMGDDPSKSQVHLISELQEWSAYDVPSDLQLPITMVDQDEQGCQLNLPAEAAAASTSMTAINKSVFLYGWATSRTTITSNRTVVKQLENELDALHDLDDSVWPSIWLCPTARSLVGKEKRGAPKGLKPWPLPDPLRREHQRRNGLDVLEAKEGGAVEDLRPNGYPCDEVIAAKMQSLRPR